MEELTEYLDHINQINRFFEKAELDLNDPQHRRYLENHLESDLSPENLTCDGELARSEVNRRYLYLTQVKKQLKALEQHEALHALYKKS